MVSIKNFLTTALFAAVALAQTSNFSASDIQALATSAKDPDDGTRLAWCSAQRTLCGTLCSGNANNNTCDSTTLNWTCNCGSNNSRPALQYYQTSMITFECTALRGKCLAAHANDLPSQDQCMKTYTCGNATDADATNAAKAASSSPTSSASSSPSGAAANSGAVSSSTHAAAAVASYGEFAPPMFVMMMVGAIASFL